MPIENFPDLLGAQEIPSCWGPERGRGTQNMLFISRGENVVDTG